MRRIGSVEGVLGRQAIDIRPTRGCTLLLCARPRKEAEGGRGKRVWRRPLATGWS